jgi:lipopolysaccharide/colanic/teichoic acid biosynthesis glycosyltransferase
MNPLHDPVKRVIDVFVACLLLLLLAPVLVVVAAIVAVGLGRPVLFRQMRAGRAGKPFSVVKFRSMRDADPSRDLVTDAERLTPLGKRLRSTSLDELPSLWNVVCGEMSLVGPRPLPVAYLDRYSAEQARRHEVRPGVTGLAQIRGRNSLSWEEKFALDLAYVESRSLGFDLRILAETIQVAVRREGISSPGEATSPEFVGSPVASADVIGSSRSRVVGGRPGTERAE